MSILTALGGFQGSQAPEEDPPSGGADSGENPSTKIKDDGPRTQQQAAPVDEPLGQDSHGASPTEPPHDRADDRANEAENPRGPEAHSRKEYQRHAARDYYDADQVNVYSNGQKIPTFEEALEELEPLREHLALADTSDLECIAPSSENTRLVVISCLRYDLAFAAAHALISKITSSHQRSSTQRCIDLSRSGNPGLNLLSDATREKGKDKEKGNTSLEPLVVLIEMTERMHLLEHLVDSRINIKEKVSKKLQQLEIHIIIALESNLLEDLQASTAVKLEQGSPRAWVEAESTGDPWIQHIQIDTLWHLLRQKFSSAEARERHSQIKTQRSVGKWPASDHEFFEEVSRYLTTSGERLDQAIQLKDGDPSPEDFTPFPSGRNIEQYAVCLAAYFPGLSMQNFEALILYIVGDDTYDVEEEDSVLTAEGMAEFKTTRVTKSLRQAWAHDPDAVLERCGLQNLPPRGQGTLRMSQGIHFSDPGVRERARTFIETRHPKLILTIHQKLFEPRFFLFSHLPEHFRIALFELATNHSVQELRSFDFAWIENSLTTLWEKLIAEARVEVSEERQRLIYPTTKEWQEIPRRLAWILHRVHQNAEQGSELQSLLSSKVSNPGIEFPSLASHFFLLTFLELFREGKLQLIDLLRDLLDHGSIRDLAVSAELYALIKHREVRPWEFLEKVSPWLPKGGAQPSTPSERAIDWLIWRLLTDSATSHALLRELELAPDHSTTLQRVSRLSDWLVQVLPQGDQFPALHVQVADLLLDWCYALEGLGPVDQARPEARQITDALLREFATPTQHEARRQLLNTWNERGNEYLDRLKDYDRQRRQVIRQLRRKVVELRKRFQTIRRELKHEARPQHLPAPNP